MIKIPKYRHFQNFHSIAKKKKYKQAAIKILFKRENSFDAVYSGTENN